MKEEEISCDWVWFPRESSFPLGFAVTVQRWHQHHDWRLKKCRTRNQPAHSSAELQPHFASQTTTALSQLSNNVIPPWTSDTQTCLVLELCHSYFSQVTYSNVNPFEKIWGAVLSLCFEISPINHLKGREMTVFSLEKRPKRWMTLSYKMSHCDACHVRREVSQVINSASWGERLIDNINWMGR